MSSIEKAKILLKEKNATLVAVKGDEEYISHDRGVAPILNIIDNNPVLLNGASVADKVIGKAAAMLLAKYGVCEIHAVLISEKALDYLKTKPIKVTYDSEVDCIINRDKTDMCPMEKSVLFTDDENEAEALIRKTREKLLKK
ncbi:MAG: DUF1893 domain-containing protein [Clostridia bacterium]|nr:DUF1893 domain-containing protein [Clostridia bacterium]